MNPIKALFTFTPMKEAEPFILSKPEEPEFDIRKEKKAEKAEKNDEITCGFHRFTKYATVPIKVER